MANTAADILIDTIQDWGVDTIFGLPGDGINGIMEALRRRQESIRFVQVRHEESAAFMACAYAKYTGKLGVCLATSGPGGIHLLNGLYDAKLDGQPVLAITGHHYHDLIDTHAQQDVNLDRVFMDVAVYTSTSRWTFKNRKAGNVPSAIFPAIPRMSSLPRRPHPASARSSALRKC
jgi:pyruvate dehydrogenase (quinone)